MRFEPLSDAWEGQSARRKPSAPSPETSLGHITSTYGGWGWEKSIVPFHSLYMPRGVAGGIYG